MPCTKCRSDFNLLTWKLRCIECELPYCSKCLKKYQGCLMCETCSILNKRPPDRDKLMSLKSKDIQNYLNKKHISTYGIVEKPELVDLFYRRPIPSQRKRDHSTLSSVFGGSVPNLASQTEEKLNKVASNLETNLNHIRDYAEAAYNNISRLPENFFQANSSTQSNTNTTGNTNYQSSNYNASNTSRRMSENDLSTHQSASNSQTSNQNKEDLWSTKRHLKLSDFQSIEDIEQLSVRQLKEVLALNRVDFKGCVERNELQEKVVRLWIDSRMPDSSKETDDSNMDNLCKICMDAPLSCVILECGHIATCLECGKQLAECPICRQFVTRVVRVFKV